MPSRDASIVQYNKENYEQAISLIRLDPGESDKQKDNLILFNDNIMSFKFFNDVVKPVPGASIVFEDVGMLEIPKYKPDGYTFLRYHIKYTVGDTGETIDFVHDFIVQNIKVVNKKSESVIYEIEGDSIYGTYRDAQVLYSSKKEKSLTKIIEEIYNAAKYPIDKNQDMTHSDKKEFYIAKVNSSVGETVDNILSYCMTPQSGLYYVMHHMLNNKAKIISFKDVYDNMEIGQFNYLNIPTKDDFDNFQFSLMNLSSDSPLGGNHIYENIKELTFNNFDYLQRKWTKDIYKFKRLDKIQSKVKSKDYQKIYKEIPEIYTNKIRMAEEHQPGSYFHLGEKMSNLNMFTDIIQFRCVGNIKREVGELFLINCGNPTLYNRYRGLWFVTRIYHKFEAGTYFNEIIAIRTDEMKVMYRK